jgi:hypothetical protein
MRKTAVVLIVFTVISVGLFSGCTEDKDTEDNVPTNQETSDNENILGKWINYTKSVNLSGVNGSIMRVYNFFDDMVVNSSVAYIIGSQGYRAYTEGIYELKEGNLILTNATMVPPLQYTYTYSFNNDYTTLTLTNSSGSYWVFHKQ